MEQVFGLEFGKGSRVSAGVAKTSKQGKLLKMRAEGVKKKLALMQVGDLNIPATYKKGKLCTTSLKINAIKNV